ncbi:MAG: RAMP superfamily CRISPR-associated protein [Coleofasciculus sp. C1-SOL-03]|uniref:RAMP superfamily CRISPR-associated protein n=1 Tax=Coleofasciculus sp. C1-SOL-03 TaxID=3069522 RepID=UPI0033027650
MSYNKPRPRSQPSQITAPKPYHLIPLPKQKPQLKPPKGQDQYYRDHVHGTLHLQLTVQTGLHVSTGVVALGTDVGQKSIPLIKTMIQGSAGQLMIPGSSLKGVVRSTYEAITRSCLCKTKAKSNQIPPGYQECRDQTKLCPACRVFGALNWQGLIQFNDAECELTEFRPGFMPSLYRPHPDEYPGYFNQGKVAGRKFYYHTNRAIDKGQQQGISVQQAVKTVGFSTSLPYRNLTKGELGTLLIVLGQDKLNAIALKVGGGKPIGMGTMTVEVTSVESVDNIRDRYLSYQTQSQPLTGKPLQQFIQQAIQAAHRELVQSQPLQELVKVLGYPTDREPPEGMY